MSGRFDALADRLDAIAEELADSAIDELKSALRRSDRKPPASEWELTRARRAVEKAAHLLRNLETADTDDENDESAASSRDSDPFD